jgi:hypothetical protein
MEESKQYTERIDAVAAAAAADDDDDDDDDDGDIQKIRGARKTGKMKQSKQHTDRI